MIVIGGASAKYAVNVSARSGRRQSRIRIESHPFSLFEDRIPTDETTGWPGPSGMEDGEFRYVLALKYLVCIRFCFVIVKLMHPGARLSDGRCGQGGSAETAFWQL